MLGWPWGAQPLRALGVRELQLGHGSKRARRRSPSSHSLTRCPWPCTVVPTGKMCIEVTHSSKIAKISEMVRDACATQCRRHLAIARVPPACLPPALGAPLSYALAAASA